MKYTPRMAAGVVALAAIFIPAQAIAGTSGSPAPAPSHVEHASRPQPKAAHVAARRHTKTAAAKAASATTVSAARAAAAAAPGTTQSPIILKLDRDQSEMPSDGSPGYATDFADWVSCMNAEGLPIVATSTGVTAGGWTFGTPTTAHQHFLDSLAGEDARDQIEDNCVVQAFNLNG